MGTVWRAPSGASGGSTPAGTWTGRAGRPRVAITYPYPIGNRVAGGSRTTPEVARGLARLGVAVVLLPVSTNALSRRFPRRPPEEDLGLHLDASLAAEGVRVVRVPQHPVHQLLDALCVRDAISDLLAEGPLDAVIGHLHEAGALPSLLAARGVPFVYFATWQTYSRFQDRHQGIGGALRQHTERRLIVEAHRRAERIFAISDFTRRELVELFGVERERIELCPLGVDPSFRAIERPRREGVRNLLFFGRIVYWKGFLDALEALGQVARGGQRDWTYRLVGFGHKQRALDAAREFGIGEQVEVLDPVDDAGLREHLAWADLAVMPSYFESFGLSIAEAQAAGLPVVAYAAGSVPEVVLDGHTGWLAPARDIRALAERIGAALADPAEAARRGAAGRARAAAEFDWQRTARILYGGLAELAGARASSSVPA